jgi:hypothetical protein
MSRYELLEQAIREKKQVHAIYNGCRREMCPHVLGLKNGVMHCLLYQFGGDSSSRPIVSGSPQNWRCLDISRLEDLELVEGEWFTADNHSRKQTCVDEVLEIIDYD